MYTFPFALPPFYVAIIRCLGVLEGVAIQVDPGFRIASDSEQEMNLNLIWWRRWRRGGAASLRRRLAAREFMCLVSEHIVRRRSTTRTRTSPLVYSLTRLRS